MLIHTAEGKRSIDDDLVLCIDRHRGETERCIVTLYLLSGEQVTGVLETTLPEDDAPPLAAWSNSWSKAKARELGWIV
jgi:hypothetical protein